MEHYDVAIIGAGFGGLACALTLAQRGQKVVLFERLTYPGGCASTFVRRGYRFESGATLFCGFHRQQLFHRWIESFGLDVVFQPLDPILTLRSEEFTLDVPSERERLVDEFCALPGAPKKRLRDFFDWQRTIADALWDCFADPDLLPPLGVRNLARHFLRAPRYLRLARLVGTPLGEVLRRHQLWDYLPFRTYANALCQITVQTDANSAEAPFALGAMDYFFRGTGHIHGGIGVLARALSEQITVLGGNVKFAEPVWRLIDTDRGWEIETRRDKYSARQVVANTLPANLADLLGKPVDDISRLSHLHEQVTRGWGAAMLYLGVDASKISNPCAHHLQLIDSTNKPLREGNHIFCSVSGADEPDRSPSGERTATVSTHVDMGRLWTKNPREQAEYVAAVQHRMRRTLERRAPDLWEAVCFEMTASPRTFERFTNRRRGYVGGIPRTAGLHNYRHLSPYEVHDGLYLVGDTVFPGQSVLAVALGGVRVAEAIAPAKSSHRIRHHAAT